MGLDQYILAKKSFPRFNSDEAETRKFEEIMRVMQLDLDQDQGSSFHVAEISVNVAYWRKANQIHQWFVHNIQEDVDNCGTYYVARDQLKGLVETCNEILEIKDLNKRAEKASELLPTQSGFFFGSTSYGDDYFEDLERTVTQINKILTDSQFEECSFYYTSSW